MAEILRGADALRDLANSNKTRSSGNDPAPDAGAEKYKMSRSKGRAAGARLLKAGVGLSGKLYQAKSSGNAAVRLWITNLPQFQGTMVDLAEAVNDWVKAFYVDFVEDLYTTVIGRTPLRTGRARANWKVGSTAEDHSVLAAPGNFPNPIPSGVATIRSVDKSRLNLAIVNNVTYIADLDNGTSKQAPQGIVDVSIAETLLRSAAYLDASNAESERT